MKRAGSVVQGLVSCHRSRPVVARKAVATTRLHLLVAAVGVLLLSACGGSDERVRRPAPLATADARIAVIGSGEPFTPPRPTPTPMPRPTCAPDALWWYEARYELAKQVTVEGPVAEVETEEALSLGQRVRDPNRLRLVIEGGAADQALVGRTVCATGTARLVNGVPTLELASAADLRVIE